MTAVLQAIFGTERVSAIVLMKAQLRSFAPRSPFFIIAFVSRSLGEESAHPHACAVVAVVVLIAFAVRKASVPSVVL